MKRFILSALLTALSSFIFSQTANYWVVFKDKKNSPFQISSPHAYLSERSIARREKQHIAINERDLPVNPDYINGLIKSGAVLKLKSKWYNAVSITLLDAKNLELIYALPYVKSIRTIADPLTSSSKVNSKFEIESAINSGAGIKQKRSFQSASLDYGPSYEQVHMIGADCMHDKNFMGQGMVIAQLDAGFLNVNILPEFDSLRANNQILGCRDFVTGDTMVYEDNEHGMYVLSTMGGNIPGEIIGTAPKAAYWLLRTEVAASESLQEEINWLAAAEFADSVGADIINSSLGYNYFDNTADNHTYADMDGNTTIVTKAADWAASVGILVVSSAGNSGGYPWFKITAPGDADSILTVGAVDSQGNAANFSSRGPTYDGRIKPNSAAMGVQAAVVGTSGGIIFLNGTSFSSPITAGAAACLWQANPLKTNMQLLYAIEQSCNQSITPDTIKGYGIPNFCTANMFLLGISENTSAEENFTIFPNPFMSDFIINFYSLKKQTAHMELFDIAGRRISEINKTMDNNALSKFDFPDSGSLAEGMYVLQITANDRTYYKKIVKE